MACYHSRLWLITQPALTNNTDGYQARPALPCGRVIGKMSVGGCQWRSSRNTDPVGGDDCWLPGWVMLQQSIERHSTVQHGTTQYSTSTAQHSTAQHSTTQHGTRQYSTSTAQHSTAPASSTSTADSTGRRARSVGMFIQPDRVNTDPPTGRLSVGMSVCRRVCVLTRRRVV